MNEAPLAAGPTPATVARVGHGFRLQWEPAQSCFVLLYPEGMVKLNQSAGEIMKRCDGRRDVAAIVADLESAFSTAGLEADVLAFLALAHRQRWLDWEAAR
jgi:pyrroloquinoline quinone biosynthesis protein D